jgi:hypothetical protein
MTEHFLTYEQSLAVKELGFDEPCLAWHVSKEHGLEIGQVYERDLIKDAVIAPLKSQFFKWVREKYNLRGFIGFRLDVKQFDCHIYDMSLSGLEYVKQRTMKEYNKDTLVGTYEQAEDACINKIIQILKEKI